MEPPSREVEVEVYRAERAHELMLNEATSAFEHAAIAPLLLLNGGGAVAFLTLLGAINDPKSKLSASTGWAIAASAAWTLGLIAAALGASFGLTSQRAFSKAHRIERQQVERLLLGVSPIVNVVAPPPKQRTWNEQRKDEWAVAKRSQRRYEALRWTSIAAFVAGVGCAAVSVA
jgi:hypothetical protein